MAYTPINLGSVDNDNTGDFPKPAGQKINDNFASIDTQLALKAPVANPTLTGNVGVPTRTTGDSTANAASTAFVANTVAPINTAITALQATTIPTPTPKTGAYTLVLGDAGQLIEMNLSSAANVTIPPNSSVAFPINTFLQIAWVGTGQPTIVPGAGVTLRPASSVALRAQWSEVGLRKRGTDEWVVSGDIA